MDIFFRLATQEPLQAIIPNRFHAPMRQKIDNRRPAARQANHITADHLAGIFNLIIWAQLPNLNTSNTAAADNIHRHAAQQHRDARFCYLLMNRAWLVPRIKKGDLHPFFSQKQRIFIRPVMAGGQYSRTASQYAIPPGIAGQGMGQHHPGLVIITKGKAAFQRASGQNNMAGADDVKNLARQVSMRGSQMVCTAFNHPRNMAIIKAERC